MEILVQTITMFLGLCVVITSCSVIGFYYKAWKKSPRERGLKPLHVWLIGTSTMLAVFGNTMGIMLYVNDRLSLLFLVHILSSIGVLVALQVIGNIQWKTLVGGNSGTR